MPTKRLVCLANSRKTGGRCIAGIELCNGRPLGWIRPVSDREHEEVSEAERQYRDGSEPRVLDIIDVPLLEPKPRDYQSENWLLDPTRYWKKVGTAAWRDLEGLTDSDDGLWIDGHYTSAGINDKIPLMQVGNVRSSLRLIRVESLRLSVFSPGKDFGNPRRRVQARFRHRGTKYWVWVTDPGYETNYLARPDGEYEIGEAFLTVSLGEPYEGACYKLVAAVIQRNRGRFA